MADFLAVGVVGGPQTVRAGLQALVVAMQANEFMLVSDVYDPALRLRSLEITAQAHAALSPARAAYGAERADCGPPSLPLLAHRR